MDARCASTACCYFEITYLHLLKRTPHLPKGNCIPIIDGCGFVRLQTLIVEACSVSASQIGKRVGAADVLQGGVDTRDGVGPLHLAQVHLWLDIVHIMIVASNH